MELSILWKFSPGERCPGWQGTYLVVATTCLLAERLPPVAGQEAEPVVPLVVAEHLLHRPEGWSGVKFN
jgi:hypothetical protein